jgi:hypothetical protein
MLEELRLRLVDLYADLAAHTKPECTRRWKRAARRVLRLRDRVCARRLGRGASADLASRGEVSLLTEELPGDQIKHKSFGLLANQLLSHFVKFKMSIVEYYLVCRRCLSHRGLSKFTCIFTWIKPYLEAALPAKSFIFR